MVFSSSVIPVYADSEEDNLGSMRRNPFYVGKEISYSTLDSLSTEVSETKTHNGTTYYSKGKELYKIVRNNFVKRNEKFSIHYLSASRIRSMYAVWNLVETLLACATDDELAVGATDGDYIRWAIYSYGFPNDSESIKLDYTYNGYCYYTIDLMFEYYDSAAEEEQVDKAVNSFISTIDTNSMTDYEIIKKIHNFICSGTTYDDLAAYNIQGREYAATAYGALVRGKCICQGYAVAFYRICKELGYSARFVSSPYNEGCHAWNIVELDGKYYFVDTTWDDIYMDSNSSQSPYSYFLVNYSSLRADDSFRNEHKLDERYYGTEYFQTNYRSFIDGSNYNAKNKNLYSQSVISLPKTTYAYTGSAITPKVTVSSSGEPESCTFSYKNNVNSGKATVNICSSESKRVLSHRDFIITPYKISSPSLSTKERGTDYIVLGWEKPSEKISGYAIQMYKDGQWKTVKTVSSSATTAKINSLTAARKCSFRIRIYVTVSSRKYYGEYSKVLKTATKPKTPKAKSVSSKSKSITLKWKKVYCSGYEIQYSRNKSMNNAQSVTASSSATKKTIKELEKGKRYYVRVRAFKEYKSASGKDCRVSSAWSAKKKIICR